MLSNSDLVVRMRRYLEPDVCNISDGLAADIRLVIDALDAAPALAQETDTLTRAAELLTQCSDSLRRFGRVEEIEAFPYLPEMDDVAERLLSLASRPASAETPSICIGYYSAAVWRCGCGATSPKGCKAGALPAATERPSSVGKGTWDPNETPEQLKERLGRIQQFVDEVNAPPAAEASEGATRPCTCHPDDDPPRPCPQKFAYSECMRAALASALSRERASADNAARYLWLRDVAPVSVRLRIVGTAEDNAMDAAIDVARSEEETR